MTTTASFAQTPLGFETGDVMATILNRQVGQKVELRLRSGEKIGGKLVHLSSITGMEMFEAVVLIDDVSAVLVRAAK